MLGGLSFPCQEHSPGARTQAVLCLCGCVIHRLRGCPRCRVWCCSWPKCWLCPLVISAVSCDVEFEKGCVGKYCVSMFCVLGRLRITLYMLCLCGHTCWSIWCARPHMGVACAQMGLVSQRRWCVFYSVHCIWTSGSLRLVFCSSPVPPRAPFWAVSYGTDAPTHIHMSPSGRMLFGFLHV